MVEKNQKESQSFNKIIQNLIPSNLESRLYPVKNLLTDMSPNGFSIEMD